jgi:hypothetical protein
MEEAVAEWNAMNEGGKAIASYHLVCARGGMGRHDSARAAVPARQKKTREPAALPDTAALPEYP